MLKDRTALVTGSTSGIGRGIALALAEAGADIVLNGFGTPAEIALLQNEIETRFAVRTLYAPADIARPDEIAAMVAGAMAKFGGVDILVNNAGVQHTARVEEFPVSEWDQVLAINLSGAFHAIRVVLPHMKHKGWGRIINIASAHGLVASAQKAAYVAAKHGIMGLTKVVAIEAAPFGVTCNAICPGWVLTPLVQKQLDARAAQERRSVAEVEHDLLAEKQPLQAFTEPEQIGALAVFLCSTAARTITGAPLPIDGGWTAQ